MASAPSAPGAYNAAEFFGTQDASDPSSGTDSSEEEPYEVPYKAAVSTPDSFLPLITVEDLSLIHI